MPWKFQEQMTETHTSRLPDVPQNGRLQAGGQQETSTVREKLLCVCSPLSRPPVPRAWMWRAPPHACVMPKSFSKRDVLYHTPMSCFFSRHCQGLAVNCPGFSPTCDGACLGPAQEFFTTLPCVRVVANICGPRHLAASRCAQFIWTCRWEAGAGSGRAGFGPADPRHRNVTMLKVLPTLWSCECHLPICELLVQPSGTCEL